MALVDARTVTTAADGGILGGVRDREAELAWGLAAELNRDVPADTATAASFYDVAEGWFTPFAKAMVPVDRAVVVFVGSRDEAARVMEAAVAVARERSFHVESPRASVRRASDDQTS